MSLYQKRQPQQAPPQQRTYYNRPPSPPEQQVAKGWAQNPAKQGPKKVYHKYSEYINFQELSFDDVEFGPWTPEDNGYRSLIFLKSTKERLNSAIGPIDMPFPLKYPDLSSNKGCHIGVSLGPAGAHYDREKNQFEVVDLQAKTVSSLSPTDAQVYHKSLKMGELALAHARTMFPEATLEHLVKSSDKYKFDANKQEHQMFHTRIFGKLNQNNAAPWPAVIYENLTLRDPEGFLIDIDEAVQKTEKGGARVVTYINFSSVFINSSKLVRIVSNVDRIEFIRFRRSGGPREVIVEKSVVNYEGEEIDPSVFLGPGKKRPAPSGDEGSDNRDDVGDTPPLKRMMMIDNGEIDSSGFVRPGVKRLAPPGEQNGEYRDDIGFMPPKKYVMTIEEEETLDRIERGHTG